MFTIKHVSSAALNAWLAQRHYLHRPIIKSKLLAHGVFIGNELVGGLLWATPHFTKKRGLFGMPGTLDKWEVLMLARFYLVPNSGLLASSVLSASIGNRVTQGRGRNRRTVAARGWRLQEDWCKENPPIKPALPFLPRLLISWSDEALAPVDNCPVCGDNHTGGHKGIIYQASGWERWDVTTSGGTRTGRSYREEYGDHDRDSGNKTCWIMRLVDNVTVRERYAVNQASLFDVA